MAQGYPNIAATDLVSASRNNILARDEAIKSSFAGTTYPTTELAIGMFCYRTDLQKIYVLESTGPSVWREIAFAQGLGTAAFATVGTSGNTVPLNSSANTWSAIQTFAAGVNLQTQALVGNAGSIQLDADLRLNANSGRDINFLIDSASKAKIFADGGFTVGGPVGGSKGAGSFNAPSIYRNGVLLGSASIVDTGAGAAQVPLNSNLGALAYLASLGFANISAGAIANQAEAEAGTANNKLMTPLTTAQAIAMLGSSSSQTFTSNGTWNKPATGTFAFIRLWGGGGGGGGSNTTNTGGGGGGGACTELLILLADLNATEAVVIGAGGLGKTGVSHGVGQQGGITSFGDFIYAHGGGGGGVGSSLSAGPGGGGGGSNGGVPGNPYLPTDYTGGVGTGNGGLGGGLDGGGMRNGQMVVAGINGGQYGSYGSYNYSGADYSPPPALKGGGGGSGATNTGTPVPGGTSRSGGAGGRGRYSGGPATNGAVPGGGGGGGGSGNDAGNGGAGKVAVYVF